MGSTALLAAAGVLLLSSCCYSAAAQANAPLVPGENGGWRQGRATFYGGTEHFLQNFKDRGPPPEYGFGDAIFGSCGYTQQNYTEGVSYANVPYPKQMLAAMANIDESFPGSCGRCFEVRCKSGLVYSNGTTIFNTTQGYNLPAHAPNATDDFGRTWLGNPTAAQEEQSVRCWNDSHSITVVITDNCPCVQTDVNTGAVSGVNPPCCGDIWHMDLSYWAFELLAHPLNGIMTTEFRPVDCYTGQAMAFDPGFVNTTIYGDRVESGWSWFPYGQNTDSFWSPGFGVGGSNATCVELGPKQGGLTLACREGYQSGYQPFARGDSIEFWLRDMNGSSTIPNLQVGLGNAEQQKYCASVSTGSLTPVERQGNYAHFKVPISSFQCPVASSDIDQLSFQNSVGQLVSFCLDNIAISGASSGAVSSTSVGRRHRF